MINAGNAGDVIVIDVPPGTPVASPRGLTPLSNDRIVSPICIERVCLVTMMQNDGAEIKLHRIPSPEREAHARRCFNWCVDSHTLIFGHVLKTCQVKQDTVPPARKKMVQESGEVSAGAREEINGRGSEQRKTLGEHSS